jgi:cytochrome P450
VHADDFQHASLLEGVRFTAQVAVPNVIQGLFRRRRSAVSIATRTGADGLALGFVAGLKRSYGEGPVWIRVVKDEALLLFGRAAIRHALEGSPDPFAADPEPKKSGMSHFQPDALTISRGDDWSDRRRFTEAVLSSLPDGIPAMCAAEAASLPATLEWDAFNRAVRRVARRVILGESAADDDALSDMLGELMDKSNPPGRGDSELYERYTAALARHVDAAETGSLAARFAEAPVTERTNPVGQVTHWLFALGDTLAINAFRCLALVAAFGPGRTDDEYLGACLQEAMRLWPTTPMLSREAIRDVDWDGVSVPAGTQLLILNSFNHRDREAVPYADRFEPEAWLSGDAADDWQFNHFSHGPQGCPGAELALRVGEAMVGAVVRNRGVHLLEPRLDPAGPLPHSLDYFALRFSLD